MSHRGVETEVKISLPDASSGRRLLRRGGFRVSIPRSFESNLIFDTPESSLRSQGKVLRIRIYRGEALLTLKGPAQSDTYKSRVEIETKVQNGENLTKVLAALGFLPQFRYEKYRTEYRKTGSNAIVVLDETPIGVYLEIEAGRRSIDTVARALGFTNVNYVTMSYGRLYDDAREKLPTLPQDMIFRTRQNRRR